MAKKIILLLVEGPTDEDTLALVYSRIIKRHELKFDVLHADITADEDMTVKYIDTDGAFIPSTQIKQSDTGKTEYFEGYIAAKNKDRLVRRNMSKRNIVYRLANSENVSGFPYEIYYFSRNIEHVLHNISNDLTDEEKEDLAFKTAVRYSQRPEDFLKLLYEADFHVSGTYKETWKFIMENGNSLNRHCNMSVFFEKLGIRVDES